MLTFQQLEMLELRLQDRLQDQSEDGFNEAIEFLEMVLATFQSLNHESSLNELSHIKTIPIVGATRYARIEHLIRVLKASREEAPFTLISAFQSVFEAQFSEVTDQLSSEGSSSGPVSDEVATIEDLETALFRTFGGGLYEKFEQVTKASRCNINVSADLKKAFHNKEWGLSIQHVLQLINDCELHCSSASPEERLNLQALIKSYQSIVNEGIALIKRFQNYELTHQKNQKFSLEEKIVDVEKFVDIAFINFIQNKLQRLTELEAGEGNIQNDADFFSQAIQYCTQTFEQPDAIELSEEILQNIQSYFTLGEAPAGFGIVNPLLLLSPEKYPSHPGYQAISAYLNPKINGVIEAYRSDELYGANKRLEDYKDARRGWMQRLRNIFRSAGSSRDDSKRSRIQAATQLQEALQEIFVPDTDEADRAKEGDAITKLGAALRTCNKLVFNDEPSETHRLAYDSEAINYNAMLGNSNLKRTVGDVIRGFRSVVNANARHIETLLARSPQVAGSPSLKHCLYFELNLYTNSAIKDECENHYTKTTNRWYRRLLERITFSPPRLRNERNQQLNTLMNRLVNARTEDDYLIVLNTALSDLIKIRENHIWDKRYKETVRKACAYIVQTHVLVQPDANRRSFKLNFSEGQLRLIANTLQGLNMQQHPVSKRLAVMLKQYKATEPKDAYQLSDEMHQQLEASAEETEQQVKKAKLNAFRKALISKLEPAILSELVISTNRFMLMDRKVGIATKGLAMIIKRAPFGAAVGSGVEAVGHAVDQHLQVQEGRDIADQIAMHGGFITWWNEVASATVNALLEMFGDHIGHMADVADATHFGAFCFKRIYAALKNPNELLKAKFANNHLMTEADYLVMALFHTDDKLTKIPFRKDHYRMLGDTALIPATTFQGLLNNVSFVCETKELNVREVNETAEKEEGKGKEKESSERSTPSSVQSDNAQALESPESEGSDKKENSEKKQFKFFAMDAATRVYGKKGEERSKLAKYGIASVPNQHMAIYLNRRLFGLFTEETYTLKGQRSRTLAASVEVVKGKKELQPKTQIEIVQTKLKK